MRLYFYCIMKASGKPDLPTEGVSGQVIKHINNHDLCAAVSPARYANHPVTDENLKIHDKIVNAYSRHYDIIPFRFNTVVGERIGRGVLKRYYYELLEDIKNLSGKSQFLLHVVQKEKDRFKLLIKQKRLLKSKGLFDRDNMMKNKILDVDSKLIVSRINGPLEKLSCKSRTDRLKEGSYLLKGEYLIRNKNVSEFKSSLNRLERMYSNLNFYITGPQPPYNFVSIQITRDNTFEFKKR